MNELTLFHLSYRDFILAIMSSFSESSGAETYVCTVTASDIGTGDVTCDVGTNIEPAVYNLYLKVDGYGYANTLTDTLTCTWTVTTINPVRGS